MNKNIKKYINKDNLDKALRIEWEKNKGNVTRICNVCLKSFKATNWKQTICKEPICRKYNFRFQHIKSSYKRWKEVLEEITTLKYKPTFTNYKQTK